MNHDGDDLGAGDQVWFTRILAFSRIYVDWWLSSTKICDLFGGSGGLAGRNVCASPASGLVDRQFWPLA